MDNRDTQRRLLIINNKIQLIKHLKPATSRYAVEVMSFQFAIRFLDYL
jgi:hypothetical protein